MKLYQKVSILAVVGALSLNGNLVRADEDADFRAQMDEAIDYINKASEASDASRSLSCKACDLIAGYVGDNDSICDKSGTCYKGLANIAGQTFSKQACKTADSNNSAICTEVESYKSSNRLSSKYYVYKALEKIVSALQGKCKIRKCSNS